MHVCMHVCMRVYVFMYVVVVVVVDTAGAEKRSDCSFAATCVCVLYVCVYLYDEPIHCFGDPKRGA